jgi:hypothetical protein
VVAIHEVGDEVHPHHAAAAGHRLDLGIGEIPEMVA